jgi:hypothetical protein
MGIFFSLFESDPDVPVVKNAYGQNHARMQAARERIQKREQEEQQGGKRRSTCRSKKRRSSRRTKRHIR